MIRLDERYTITADRYNVILNYVIKPEDADDDVLERLGKERSCEERLKPLGYFSDLSGALRAYVNTKLRRSIAETHAESVQDLKKLIQDLSAVAARYSGEGEIG